MMRDPELPNGFQDADLEMRDLEIAGERAARRRRGICDHGWRQGYPGHPVRGEAKCLYCGAIVPDPRVPSQAGTESQRRIATMDNKTQSELDTYARHYGMRTAYQDYPLTLCYRYAAQLDSHPDHVMYYRRESDRTKHAAAICFTGGRITGASGGNTAGLAS